MWFRFQKKTFFFWNLLTLGEPTLKKPASHQPLRFFEILQINLFWNSSNIFLKFFKYFEIKNLEFFEENILWWCLRFLFILLSKQDWFLLWLCQKTGLACPTDPVHRRILLKSSSKCHIFQKHKHFMMFFIFKRRYLRDYLELEKFLVSNVMYCSRSVNFRGFETVRGR